MQGPCQHVQSSLLVPFPGAGTLLACAAIASATFPQCRDPPSMSPFRHLPPVHGPCQHERRSLQTPFPGAGTLPPLKEVASGTFSPCKDPPSMSSPTHNFSGFICDCFLDKNLRSIFAFFLYKKSVHSASPHTQSNKNGQACCWCCCFSTGATSCSV